MCSLLLLGVWEFGFGEKGERVSLTENRNLQPFPELTSAQFFSGAFMDELEDWLSDAFPARDRVVNLSQSALSLFSTGNEEPSAEQGNAKLFDETNDEKDELLQQLQAAEASAAESAKAAEISGAAPETNSASGSNEASSDNEPAAARLVLIDEKGKEHVSQAYSNSDLEHLAYVLNLYRSCLPEDGTLHYTSVPVSAVGCSIAVTGKYEGWYSTLDEALRPLLDEGVFVYDTPEILSPYLHDDTQYVYLSPDIHWTPLGASLVAAEMIGNTGVPVQDYYEYNYRLRSEYNKDVNRDKEELLALPPSLSDIQVQVPLSPVKAAVLTHLTEEEPCEYLLDVNQSRFDGYHLYLTGVRPPWRILRTGNHTGRTAMLISDCFGMAFVPYLTAYYDTVLMTDFRDEYYKPTAAGASAREYMQLYGVSDVFVLTSTWTPPGSYLFQNRFEQYLGTEIASSEG